MLHEMTFEQALDLIDPATCGEAIFLHEIDGQMAAVLKQAREAIVANGRQIAEALRANGFSDFGELLESYRQLKSRAVLCGRWYRPSEKKPPVDEEVLVCVSGRHRSIVFRDAFELATYDEDDGWILEGWPEFQGASVSWWMSIPKDTIGLLPADLPLFTAKDIVSALKAVEGKGTQDYDDAFCKACERRVDGACPLPDEHVCPYTDEEVALWYWSREAERRASCDEVEE